MRYLYDAWGNPISFHYDELEDTVTLNTVQDCAPLLEDNKRLRNQGDDGYSPSREMRRKARINLVLAMQWLQEDGIDAAAFWTWPGREQNEYFRKRYQDPDWRDLRTI